MSRNITIVVIILIIVLLAGYLVWLRGRYSTTQEPQVDTVVTTPVPSIIPEPTIAASASATPVASTSGSTSPSPKATK